MNKTLHTRSEKAGMKALLLMNGILLALLAYFSLVTVYSSDDYWYSTFWDNGWKHYLELLHFHYESFNGRTLVHILAQLVLHFGGWAFALVCCGLCVTSAWTVTKAAGLERGRFRAVLFVVLGCYLPGLTYVKNYNFAPEVAKKINRFTGFGMVIMGIFGLISILLPEIASTVWFWLLIPYGIATVVYALIVAGKNKAK